MDTHPYPLLTLYVEKGLGRLQIALVVAHLALVLAQVGHHGGVDGEAAVGANVSAIPQTVDLLQQLLVLVPGGDRSVWMLHDAVKEGCLSLHDGLVDGRNLDEGSSLHRQVVAGAVVAHTRRAVREYDLAVVPALVGLADGRQVSRSLAVVWVVID